VLLVTFIVSPNFNFRECKLDLAMVDRRLRGNLFEFEPRNGTCEVLARIKGGLAKHLLPASWLRKSG
jgi:hypothetical protein